MSLAKLNLLAMLVGSEHVSSEIRFIIVICSITYFEQRFYRDIEIQSWDLHVLSSSQQI